MRTALITLVAVLGTVAAATAQQFIFEQDFEDPNWMDNWVIGGDLGVPMLDGDNVVQLTPDEGQLGFEDVEGLAFLPGTGTLYGCDVATNQLITISLPSGPGVAVGALGFEEVRGLALAGGFLYGTDTATDQLITINPGTGAGTAVGSLGFDEVQALAYDPNTATLYGLDTATDQLITIDTASGAGTAVGAVGFTDVQGLAFDPTNQILYGSDTATDVLITIDTLTGAGTAVTGSGMGFDEVRGLAFDPKEDENSELLFGADTASDKLLRIRVTAGIDTVRAWVDRLGPNIGSNGTACGGITFAAPPSHIAGDNERILVDYYMDVPPGEYFFEVQIDSYMFWAEPSQPWGLGQEFYIGDASDAVPGGMDYGVWPPGGNDGGGAPSGPWKGDGWGDSNGTRLATLWNGVSDPEWDNDANLNEWRSHTFTVTRDPSSTDRITTGGTVIFRFTHRMKDGGTQRQTLAMDNLRVTLTSTNPCNDPTYDVNGDGDVDQEDFAVYQACYTATGDPGGVFDPEACRCIDGDHDQDVDEADWQRFELCASGPGVPADPACDDPI